MSINEGIEKIKAFKDKIFIITIIVLVGTASFGLGRISAYQAAKAPVKFEMTEFSANVSEASPPTIKIQEGGFVVGSKTGNKYHFPWCSGAKRMKEENKVYFASIEEAKAAGYTAAGNCKGLE